MHPITKQVSHTKSHEMISHPRMERPAKLWYGMSSINKGLNSDKKGKRKKPFKQQNKETIQEAVNHSKSEQTAQHALFEADKQICQS